MVAETDWTGLLAGRRDDEHDVVLSFPELSILPDSAGSMPIYCVGKDGGRYWVKLRENPQGDRVPITEQIIGRIGALVGLPSCGVRRMYVSSDHAGVIVPGGRQLKVGIEHASLDVRGGALFRGDRVDRARDDNARRVVGWFALFDWGWGDDVQGLWDPQDDHRFFSHDHGFYLPPGGSSWSIDELRRSVDVAHEAPLDTNGCDPFAVAEVAQNLLDVTRSQLVEVLSFVPREWNVTDQELEAVGYFFERRAPAVANRLRARFGV